MEPSQLTHVNSDKCPDAPIDPFFPKEGPAMGWTAATRRGRFLRGSRITFGTTRLTGWMLGKSDWQQKMLGKMWVSIFQTGKKGRSNNAGKHPLNDGIPIYEYRSNTMPNLGVH